MKYKHQNTGLVTSLSIYHHMVHVIGGFILHHGAFFFVNYET
uniref:Uncharacterized protein n=1 Tax=Arundo donax TaxID=35708 RepID=A0A0A9HPW1_ARUDO